MEKITVLKKLLNINDDTQDDILMFYLDCAKEIICDIRNTLEVEYQYDTVQVKIAVELYNKQGVEGQIAHNELGISRTYENSGISKSLLDEITPVAKTPFGSKRGVKK